MWTDYLAIELLGSIHPPLCLAAFFFFVSDPNSGPLVCEAGTLLTELLPHPPQTAFESSSEVKPEDSVREALLCLVYRVRTQTIPNPVDRCSPCPLSFLAPVSRRTSLSGFF